MHSHSQNKLEVKIPAEERHRSNVHQEGAQNRNNHDPMPCCDLNGNHQQLVQHKNRVADCHHAGAIHFGQDLTQALNQAALVDGDKYPDEESAVR